MYKVPKKEKKTEIRKCEKKCGIKGEIEMENMGM